ncbi:MAG TPA: disulfide bond formation protein B [Gemmatimonadales bacterium]|nr:disulfide bond formation protein B [Gemmatimonadales bacterium]
MTALPDEPLRPVLAWAVIILTAGPVGAAVWLGLVYGEAPCILCWAQRTSMVLIALVGLFVLRYGPRPRYIGMVVLLGAWGVFMSLRHAALHLARDLGQGFAAPYFGAHTYVWAWFVHWVVLGAVGVLLILLPEQPVGPDMREPGRVGRFAMGLFMVVVGANALQAFITTGPPPFIGQADPVRFSLNPRRWVWMNHEELAGPISLRGSWTIPRPDPASIDVDPDPAGGPLADIPALPIEAWETVSAPLEGRLTGLARDPATGRYLAVTDRFGVYLLDSLLARIEQHVELDHQYSIDLTPLAGAAFLGDTLALVATNKSYVLLRPDPAADADREWRYFRRTTGGITELGRSRFATVRARQQYVLSLAYDAEARELITVGVPSPRHRRLVVSRFARDDMTLASEFLPFLGPGLALRSDDRSLTEYVVTGTVVVDGLLYAISAAYSTLLVIDLDQRAVIGAYAVPGLEWPVGLAAREGELLVAQVDGRVAAVRNPSLSLPSAPR